MWLERDSDSQQSNYAHCRIEAHSTEFRAWICCVSTKSCVPLKFYMQKQSQLKLKMNFWIFFFTKIISSPVFQEIIGSSSNVGYVLCTEPRRISAVSLAERVSAEMGEPSGPGKRDSLCGYRIRFESKCGRTSRLLYCTTGVVLRRLQNDPTLADVSCVIVDEVRRSKCCEIIEFSTSDSSFSLRAEKIRYRCGCRWVSEICQSLYRFVR